MSLYTKRMGNVFKIVAGCAVGFVAGSAGVVVIASGLVLSPLPLVAEYIGTGNVTHTRNGVNNLLNMGVIVHNKFADEKHYKEPLDFFY